MESVSSSIIAATIVDELIRGGVDEFVIAPGSRNAPLSRAIVAAAEAGRIRMHTRIDERSAGFLALGLAKSGRAAAVITTSGTASANLHPAVLEASHSDLPLIAITADRPIELRDTGANQTTRQQHLFGSAVRYFAEIGEVVDDAYLRSATSRALHATISGPVHINVPLREPLVGELTPGPGRAGELPWTTVMQELPHPLDISLDLPSRGVVVVAHDHAGLSAAEIEHFAHAIGWPIVAENVLSFPSAIAHASLFLKSEEVRKELRAEMAIVVGRPVLSRSIGALIKESQRVVVIDDSYEWSDPLRVAELILPMLPMADVAVDPSWLSRWRDHQASAAKAISDWPEWSEQSLLAAFAAALPAESALFVGASRPIRDLEAFASPRFGISTYANRGLAGIDGSVSTAIGIALNSDVPTYAVMGDLTFLHDVNGLLIPDDEPQPDLTILVVDNNGGGIFSTLPQSDVPGFERIFGTPHGRDLATIASAFGAEVVRIDSLAALADVTAIPNGLKIFVAQMPDRDVNAKRLSELKLG